MKSRRYKKTKYGPTEDDYLKLILSLFVIIVLFAISYSTQLHMMQ